MKKEDFVKLDLPAVEQQLWEYIDGTAGSGEREIIAQLIEENQEWRRLYGELVELNKLTSMSELEEPSLRFTRNVMEEIVKLQIAPAARNYISKRVIWGIASFFFVMIIGLLIYGFAQVDWTTTDSSGYEIPVNLSEVDISPFFNNTYMKVFMMINVVLGLMLFDRYLERKKTQST